MPNPEWLIQQNFEPSTAEFKAPKALAGMFGDDEEKVFRVRGLTLNEMMLRDERVAAVRTDHFKKLVAHAFSGEPGADIAVANAAMDNYFGKTGGLRAVTLNHLGTCEAGCIYPELARNHWLKVSEIAPNFVVKLSRKIEALTGEGAEPGE